MAPLTLKVSGGAPQTPGRAVSPPDGRGSPPTFGGNRSGGRPVSGGCGALPICPFVVTRSSASQSTPARSGSIVTAPTSTPVISSAFSAGAPTGSSSALCSRRYGLTGENVPSETPSSDRDGGTGASSRPCPRETTSICAIPPSRLSMPDS